MTLKSMCDKVYPIGDRRKDQFKRQILGVTDAELFGERVRELREQRGLSQEKLAQAANLTTGFVNTVERGKKTPSLTTVLKLALGLKINAGELFTGFTFDVLRRLKL